MFEKFLGFHLCLEVPVLSTHTIERLLDFTDGRIMRQRPKDQMLSNGGGRGG